MYTEITSLEAALKKNGVLSSDPQLTLKIDSLLPEALSEIYQLIQISKAIREGWTPNYNDRTQRKWEPWFDLEEGPNNPSGFRFSVSGYSCTCTDSVLGPLLCQETEEKASFLGKTFEEIFRKVMKPEK